MSHRVWLFHHRKRPARPARHRVDVKVAPAAGAQPAAQHSTTLTASPPSEVSL
jgi:hypothetical protein